MWPVRSTANTSVIPFVSLRTRLEASDWNAIARAKRLSFEITAWVEGPFGKPPSSACEISCVLCSRSAALVTVVPLPEAAIAARQLGCVKALRLILGDLIDTPAFARAVELLTVAALSAPLEGRPMYAALRTLPMPEEPVARLFHAASLLREHRGDGHISALMAEGINGLEAHVLLALELGMPAEKFGRIHHLPAAQLSALLEGMKRRGLVADDGGFTEVGRQTKQRIEALTDDLAVAPYLVLDAAEVDELTAALEPLAAALVAAQD